MTCAMNSWPRATRSTNAKSTSAMFDRLETDYAAKLKAAQGAARLAAEAADRARGTPDFQKREWEHGIAALRAAVDGAVQGLLQIGRRGAQAEVDAANATAELATRKLNAVGTAIDLPRADLDKMLAEIEARRRTAERDLERAVKASAAASDAVVQRGTCASPPGAARGGNGRSAVGGCARGTGARSRRGARSGGDGFAARVPAARVPAPARRREGRVGGAGDRHQPPRSGPRAGGVRPADGVAGRPARDQAVPGAAARERRQPPARRGGAAAHGDAHRDAGVAPADRHAAATAARPAQGARRRPAAGAPRRELPGRLRGPPRGVRHVRA